MKTIFTFILMALFSLTTFAQDKIYVHTATASNITVDLTLIDHPDLNNNPNANIVISHVWNPNGESAIYNNKQTGIFYNGSNWGIYNEDASPMIEGSHYFVYIGSNDDDFITHIASVGNQHPSGAFYTVIDDTDFNGGTGPYAIMTTYFNPNSVRNTHNYGFWYDDITTNKRVIYSEDSADIPTDAAFKILKNGTGVIDRFTAESDATNISGNWFVIDNPNLNGNPDATFVFQHYWGVNGDSSETTIDKVLSAWYTGSNWAIYTEDSSPMPEGVAVDIIVAEQEILGVNDNEITENAITMFPNPATDMVNISSQEEISNISIFNILGQEVLNIEGTSNAMQIDISNLTTGNYMAKVQVGDTLKTLKLIKN
ncbi:MAG: T9SS type A sorting domain-containing protein [Flavobacteriales bacterium]